MLSILKNPEYSQAELDWIVWHTPVFQLMYANVELRYNSNSGCRPILTTQKQLWRKLSLEVPETMTVVVVVNSRLLELMSILIYGTGKVKGIEKSMSPSCLLIEPKADYYFSTAAWENAAIRTFDGWTASDNGFLCQSATCQVLVWRMSASGDPWRSLDRMPCNAYKLFDGLTATNEPDREPRWCDHVDRVTE